jgi:hypothetical protein
LADYFLVLDAALFEQEMRPALADAWRLRSFAPCRPFCSALLPRVSEFSSRYHTSEGEPLTAQVVEGLPFQRDFWRALVGELLFYAAADIPEIQTCPDTLACLLAGEARTAIRQAHFGSRDLTFGPAVYRPDQCGYNNRADVRRLADFLVTVDPGRWQADDLAALAELAGAEERQEELDFARCWWPPLAELYRQAAEKNRVIVHELL